VGNDLGNGFLQEATPAAPLKTLGKYSSVLIFAGTVNDVNSGGAGCFESPRHHNARPRRWRNFAYSCFAASF